MFSIDAVSARQVLDSRGMPTVEASLRSGRHTVIAAVPSGASTGSHEAHELRDGGTALMGKGVSKAVSNIQNSIAPKVVGMDTADQRALDDMLIALDGTEQKTALGANALLAVSLAALKLSAACMEKPLWARTAEVFGATAALPKPMLNIINGGAHAHNGLAIQEFMILPKDFPSFKEGLFASIEVFHTLKKILKEEGHSTNVGDEGGFAPNFSNSREALDAIQKAVDAAGYTGRFGICLDAASTEFFNESTQKYTVDGNEKSPNELVDFYGSLLDDYPILSIEDPCSEDDTAGWAEVTAALKARTLLVGDDLFVTNTQRLKAGIDAGHATALLVKMNQIGTLSETFDTMHTAHNVGYACVMSHRSGETEDSSIADLAVGTGCPYIKTGAPSRGERTAKYNQLLRIEEVL